MSFWNEKPRTLDAITQEVERADGKARDAASRYTAYIHSSGGLRNAQKADEMKAAAESAQKHAKVLRENLRNRTDALNVGASVSDSLVKRELRLGGTVALGVLVYGLVLSTGNGPVAALIAGGAVSYMWWGRTHVVEGRDSVRYTLWHHPSWLALVGAVGFFVSFVAALTDPGRNLTAVVLLLISLASAGTWYLLSCWVPASAKQAQAAQRPEQLPEDRARAGVHRVLFGRAGLTWKRPDGLDLYPEVQQIGEDERGRVFFDASVIPGRQTVEDFQKAGARIASAWGVPRVVVTEPHPHVARMTAILHETRITGSVMWRAAPEAEVSEYVQQLPMGAEVETGDEWTLNLAERNFVIGGIPGSGKSSFANALLAHLARHPDVRIAFIDLKFGAEAAPWAPRADAVISNTPDDPEAGTMDALRFISEAVADLGARYKRMIAAGVQNAWTEGFLGPDEPVKVLVIDECSELFKTDTPERAKLANRVIAQLKSFVQQGRAAGYVLLMSTQYPKDENLPTSIRENASDKIAFHVGSEKGMHAILGYSFVPESKADDPTRITVEERGQAVVVGDTGEAARIQMSWISKKTKTAVVESSAHFRRSWLDQRAPEPREPSPAAAPAQDELGLYYSMYPDAGPRDTPIEIPRSDSQELREGERLVDCDSAEEVPTEPGPWRI